MRGATHLSIQGVNDPSKRPISPIDLAYIKTNPQLHSASVILLLPSFPASSPLLTQILHLPAITSIAMSSTNGIVPMRPKVLVPDKVSPDGIILLRKTLDVHERRGLSPEQLLEIIPDYEAMIVRSETKVNAELLNKAKKLKVVARAGVGVDNVDVAAATKLGIIVVNSPGGNINAAAEHTFARTNSCGTNLS